MHTKLLAPNDLISLSYRTQDCVRNDNVYILWTQQKIVRLKYFSATRPVLGDFWGFLKVSLSRHNEWYQRCGLTLYSLRESMECHALRCHSVVCPKQLSDTCGCFKAGCPIQVQVAWGSCFAVICDLVLFSINVCSSFNKGCVENINDKNTLLNWHAPHKLQSQRNYAVQPPTVKLEFAIE